MDEYSKPRAPSEAVELRRAAIDVLRPLHHQVPQWQQQARRLAALGERGRLVTRDHLAEADALVETIESARKAFAEARSSWPEKVAQQSRVVDVERALTSVAQVAHEAKRALTDRRPRLT